MGKLADAVIGYLNAASKEQLLKDWEELKRFNEGGPDILEVIGGYKSDLLPPFTVTEKEMSIIRGLLEDNIESEAERLETNRANLDDFNKEAISELIEDKKTLLKRIKEHQYGKEMAFD